MIGYSLDVFGQVQSLHACHLHGLNISEQVVWLLLSHLQHHLTTLVWTEWHSDFITIHPCSVDKWVNIVLSLGASSDTVHKNPNITLWRLWVKLAILDKLRFFLCMSPWKLFNFPWLVSFQLNPMCSCVFHFDCIKRMDQKSNKIRTNSIWLFYCEKQKHIGHF